ncbi:MAG: dTDP-4-dehydrorhamnose reductase [Gammaproteobacteria bacterium]|nr:MAG: dTDP-4-dehydrorhamnose reductase [Gammaproteobacteria bacterium]
MKFLVTGANGQLGCCLVDRLSNSGHTFVALTKSDLDITDEKAVEEQVVECRPDVIVNAAAYTSVDRAESEPELARRINGEAVNHLVRAANKVGALLIQVSTDYVFDGTSPEPYVESDAVNPLGVYGESKLLGEEYAARADRFLVVRTAWVFSEYGNNFVKTMLKLGRKRKELSIVSDQYGSPTYAGGLAASLIRMSEAQLPSGIYHFSGGKSCSWFEFATVIFNLVKASVPGYPVPGILPITSEQYPTPAKRPAFSVLSDKKLKMAMDGDAAEWPDTLPDVIKQLLKSMK